MTAKRYRYILTILLIIVVCANLFNVGSVQADGETPTEPPAPTQVETEPPTEEPTEVATQVPTEPPTEQTETVEATPVPEEATATPIPEELTATPVPEEVTATPTLEEVTATPVAEILTEVPEGVEVVILDENGQPVPLAAEKAAEIIAVVDPMWCPEGVLPGGPGCTTNFASISALITNMVIATSNYAMNGVIYFTSNPGPGTFNLSPTTLSGGAFNTLKNFSLTLQGGWNGSTVTPTFGGQTNFGTSPITIGTAANPWVGNITVNNITWTGASQTSLTVYTTTGNIELNNVEVYNQGNGKNTALLNTASGNIKVANGIFDGNGTNSGGFSATTGTGSITITDTSFTDNKIGTGTVDGATLSAAIVTLTNVIAGNNDGDGITINNASVVTLNNVVATYNGTDPAGPGNNDGSGILINGTAGSNVFINGGSFSFNKEYGIEIGNLANTIVYIVTSPTCVSNVLGCSNTALVVDGTAPVITPSVSGTTGSAGWYTSNVTVSWSVDDPETGIASSTGCGTSNLTSGTAGTTLTCSATNNVGLSGSASVTIKIDKNAPVLSLPADITATATGSSGAAVSYAASATDDIDASVAVVCSPASGWTFAIGTTTVNCSASDDAGNYASGSFLVTVTAAPVTATPAPTSTSGSESNSSTSILPITGGIIDLDCDTVLSAFGIRLSFINLCDQQAVIEGINPASLPGKLPGTSTLVTGLDVKILSEGAVLEGLPDRSGIQLDFPTSAGATDLYAALYWDGSAWVEITQKATEDEVSVLVETNAADEFYQMESDGDGFYKILTTDKTGIFVLVIK